MSTSSEVLRASRALAAGLGEPRILTSADPGPGAEPSITLPGGFLWTPLDFRVVLVAGAAVANRTPQLTFDDGTTILEQIAISANPITANQTWTMHFAAALGKGFSDATSFVKTAPMQRFILPAGYRVRIVTANLQGADDYAAPRLFALGYPLGRAPGYGD